MRDYFSNCWYPEDRVPPHISSKSRRKTRWALMCAHVSRGTGSRLPAQGSSRAATCPVAPALASELRAALKPPRCDRTTSEISQYHIGDSRRSENAQIHTYKHTVPNIKFKLKLLQLKCHVLEFIKDKAQNGASKDNQSFCGSVRLSR
jgi:hypothetical protein